MLKIHIKLLTLLCILCLKLTQARTSSYLSVPFRKVETDTHQAHLIEVEINQYVYSIDVTLENTDDFIFQLPDAHNHHSPTSTPDYRKYNDSVYGIIRPIAVQRVDHQLSALKRITRNAYYYLKNIERKAVWTNQKYIKQLPWTDKSLSEGTFNVGANKKIIAFDDILKYSKYMTSAVVCWKLHDNEKEGQLILGDFPLNELQSSSQYQQIRLHAGSQYEWTMDIVQIKLKKMGEAASVASSPALEILNVSSRFKVNLGEKRFKLPKAAIDALLQHLPGCQLAKSNTGGHPLVCQTTQIQFYHNFILQLFTKKDGFSIDIPLGYLTYNVYGDRFVMHIQLATKDDFQISPIVLKQYLVGLNYRNSTMFIGRKASDPLLDRYFLLNMFIAVNVIILIGSLFVLSVAAKYLKLPPKTNEGGFELSELKPKRTPKCGGYIMADEDQNSPAQQQKIIA